jgi:hypothetical protein
MKNAMHPPSNGPEVEPWADALDELDPRELAMNRFRTRNEMLEEVFGPEPISMLTQSHVRSTADEIESIPLGDGDAWAGLGMDGESLEAKVVSRRLPFYLFVILMIKAALEKENQELETSMDERLSSWTQHLASIETSESAPAVTV